MYDTSSFYWTLLIATVRMLASGSFYLLVAIAGAAVIWRARRLAALRGVRWAGAGLLLYGLTGLLAAATWFLVSFFDVWSAPTTTKGMGLLNLSELSLQTIGWLTDAACLFLIALGVVATLRRLATPAPRKATRAEPDDEDVTDPRGLAVVNAK